MPTNVLTPIHRRLPLAGIAAPVSSMAFTSSARKNNMSASTLRARLQQDAQAVFGPPSSLPTPLEPLQLRKLLLPDAASASALPITKAIWNNHLPVTVHTAPGNKLDRYAEALREGCCMPLGGSEYARRCMSLLGVPVPQMNCYPKPLLAYMLHMPRKVTASVALVAPRPVFVKPVASGLFPAFVLRQDESDMTAQDLAALGELLDLPHDEHVWVASELPLASEWRYFVLSGEVIGYSPIAPVTPGTLEPDLEEVSGIVTRLPTDIPVAIDMGVLEDGTTTLLRVRDPWTLEYLPYGDDRPKPLAFLAFVWERWAQVYAGSRFQAANSALLPIS